MRVVCRFNPTRLLYGHGFLSATLRTLYPLVALRLYLSKIFSLHLSSDYPSTNGTAADPIDGGASATLLLPPGDTGNH